MNSFFRNAGKTSVLGQNLLVVVAIGVGGWVASLLATNSFATAVWPPAGFALAALLLFGCRIIPGIMVGSVIIELWIKPENVSLLGSSQIALLVCAIAVGASLQASLGAYLVRRKLGPSPELINVAEIGRFFLLVGPVSCLVNSSVGVSTLTVIGALDSGSTLLTWLVWWLGDMVGVFVFTPLAMIFFAQPRVVWKPRMRSVAFPLFIIILIVMVAYAAASRQEKRQLEAEFFKRATFAENAINKAVSDNLDALYSLKAFYSSSEEVNRESFKAFAQSLLDRKPGIRGLSWNRVVSGEQRTGFEQGIRAETGNNIFSIHEINTEEKSVKAEQRSRYVVVTYIEPENSNRSALGLDVYSNPERRLALDKAMRSGEMTTTPPIQLVQNDSGYGALVFLPIHKRQSPLSKPSEPIREVFGYVTLVVDIESMISATLARLPLEGVEIKISGQDQRGKSVVLFSTPPAANLGLNPDYAFSPGYSKDLAVADQHWQLLLSASPAFPSRSWGSWIVLTVGLLFVSFMSGFLLELSGRNLTTEKLVWQRTEDLAQANAVLQESENRFRALVEQSITGIYVFQRDKFIYINQKFCEMFGYTEKEILDNLKPTDVIDKNDRALATKLVDQRLSGAADSTHYTARGLRADGSKLWVDIHGTRMDLHGEPAVTGTVLDITERKKAEDEIHQLNVDLEQRVIDRTRQLEAVNKELESFSYSVSHDLKAPLRAIVGFSQIIMEDDAELPEQTRQYLQMIVDSGTQMGKLIASLLDFSRLGRSKLNEGPVDMTLLFREEVAAATAEAKDRMIDCRMAALPGCVGDAMLLRQVVANLVSNAVKFTLGRERAEIEIGSSEKDGQTIYFIKDNGVGFDMRYANKIFGVFQRLHSIQDFEGTGIGMALVQSILGRHGGSVWTEAELDKGATFFFTVAEKPGWVAPVVKRTQG